MKPLYYYLAFICLASGLAAQEQYPNYAELHREQEAISERLYEAERFLEDATTSFDRTLYNYSFETLLQASGRLETADHRLEAQIDQIANMRPSLFRSRTADREELNERRRDLRQQYFGLNRRAQSLSRDILPYVGVNLDEVRWQMSVLRWLAENHPDPAVRERAQRLLQQGEAALESGDRDALETFMNEADDVINDSEDALEGSGVGSRPESDDAETDTGPQRDERRDTRTERETSPAAMPDHLNEDMVQWLHSELARLCSEIEDPELRRRICDLRDDLEAAVAAGDWDRVTEILEETRSDIMPRVRDADESAYNRINPIPVNIDGEIRYFPADFNAQEVGTRYVGGQGARLIEENQESLRLTGRGTANERWDTEVGETRSWRFNIAVTEENVTDEGYEIAFRFDERNREGDYDLSGWRVTGPNDRTVAEGQGETGQAALTETGRYTIEFSGETDWGSPFRIQSQVDIAL